MKPLVILTLLLFSYTICLSKTDTVRMYVYENSIDCWKMEVSNHKTYSLYSSLATNCELVTKGVCLITDTSFLFTCDTSRLKNKRLASDLLKKFSNIPYILTGTTFKRCENFFVPYNIVYPEKVNLDVSKHLTTEYYTSNGYSGYSINLQEDSSYVFNDFSCMGKMSEKGRWTIKNGSLFLEKEDGKEFMLNAVTDNGRFYITNDFLVGKKTRITYTNTHKPIVTVTYLYLQKSNIEKM